MGIVQQDRVWTRLLHFLQKCDIMKGVARFKERENDERRVRGIP